MNNAIIFGLTFKGMLWKNYSWISHSGVIPSNFFDNISSNSDFDHKEYEQTEIFKRPATEDEVTNNNHLEWVGIQ